MVANLHTRNVINDDDELAYTYSNKPRHLTDKEALEKYQKAKISDPEAVVELEDLDCGHWIVNVYRTNREKKEFLARRAESMIERLLKVLKTPLVR